MLLVKKNFEDSKIPCRADNGSVGYDLYSYESVTLPSGKRIIIDTGISFTVPDGTYGRIAPRSGLALKNGIDVMAGVIDPSYTGPVKVILFNTDSSDFKIEKGDKIAQLILEKVSTPEIKIVDKLEKTTRGTSGFGSTGNK
jgi:dUTP pyrophosphatase